MSFPLGSHSLDLGIYYVSWAVFCFDSRCSPTVASPLDIVLYEPVETSCTIAGDQTKTASSVIRCRLFETVWESGIGIYNGIYSTFQGRFT